MICTCNSSFILKDKQSTVSNENKLIIQNHIITGRLMFWYKNTNGIIFHRHTTFPLRTQTLDFKHFSQISGMEHGIPPTEEAKKKLDEAVALLNTLLEGHDWVAGDHVTIADFAIVANISTIVEVGQGCESRRSYLEE